jgi:hypothetical protein
MAMCESIVLEAAQEFHHGLSDLPERDAQGPRAVHIERRRRQVDADDVQAVIERLHEGAGLYQWQQSARRGRDNLRSSHRCRHPIEQLMLIMQRQRPDILDDQRPAFSDHRKRSSVTRRQPRDWLTKIGPYGIKKALEHVVGSHHENVCAQHGNYSTVHPVGLPSPEGAFRSSQHRAIRENRATVLGAELVLDTRRAVHERMRYTGG